MELQELLLWSTISLFLSAIAMKLLLHRAGSDVNAVLWNFSYAREFRDFSELCRLEPYPTRLFLRLVQVVYVGSFVAWFLAFFLGLLQVVIR